MNHIEHGDMLSAKVNALVNTVNTEGVSGKGIALQFKMRYPQNYRAYRSAAKRGEVKLGKVFPVWIGALDGPQWIINFPTKGHWRTKSRLADVETGLDDLVRAVEELGIRSVAVPPLGCGNGGLDWDIVRPIIEEKLSALKSVEVLIYSPDGAPPPMEMRVDTVRPRMTVGRSTLLVALNQYVEESGGATKLVIQKLAYLLQEAGIRLGLNFVKAPYGPYSETMNHVLQGMEGHYTVGYGDRTTPSPIQILPGAYVEAIEFLSDRPQLMAAVDRVKATIEGFESPYALELLTTVHYVATHGDHPARTVEQAIRQVGAWSDRKERMFPEEHIRIVWDQLESQSWLPQPQNVV